MLNFSESHSAQTPMDLFSYMIQLAIAAMEGAQTNEAKVPLPGWKMRKLGKEVFAVDQRHLLGS